MSTDATGGRGNDAHAATLLAFGAWLSLKQTVPVPFGLDLDFGGAFLLAATASTLVLLAPRMLVRGRARCALASHSGAAP